jgi:hypothetical protein
LVALLVALLLEVLFPDLARLWALSLAVLAARLAVFIKR